MARSIRHPATLLSLAYGAWILLLGNLPQGRELASLSSTSSLSIPIPSTPFYYPMKWFEENIKNEFVVKTPTIGPRLGTPGRVVHESLPRILAIYFPQYHRDPLNDKNWGDNFTDWVSLQKSPTTNREGFPIPRPLADEAKQGLGYYDLRQTAPRRRQGELAQQYGVDGFIYHHYWFYDPAHPGPNLAQPLLNMLDDGHPNMPFLLNWCATKWVNVWMGKAIFQKIRTNKNRAITLQNQYFNATTDMIREHYTWLAQFFHHPNYIKIGGTQPVLMLYYYDKLALPILRQLRQLAIEDGFDSLYLVVGRSASPLGGLYDTSHLEGRKRDVMEKQLQTIQSLPVQNNGRKYHPLHQLEGVNAIDSTIFNQSMTYPYPLSYIDQPFQVPQWCRDGLDHPPDSGPFPLEVTGVVTTFDNTPRREYKTATMYNQGPTHEVLERFEKNLYAALYFQKCCQGLQSDQHHQDEKFIAINAWNEWAEGMVIEPSDVYGYGWLEVIQKVKNQTEQEPCTWSKQ